MRDSTRQPLDVAIAFANQFAEKIRPYCDRRLTVAGSIRRECETVGDIEIVTIPKYPTGLFGEPLHGEESLLSRMLRSDKDLIILKSGPRYTQVVSVSACWKIDIFTPTLETWGVTLVIRTGPSEFSHQLVTSRLHVTSTGRPGLLPTHLVVRGGRICGCDGQAIPTPEEEDVFRAIGLDYIEPRHRR